MPDEVDLQSLRRQFLMRQGALVELRVQPRSMPVHIARDLLVALCSRDVRLKDIKWQGLRGEIGLRLTDALGCERYAERKDTLGGALQKTFGDFLSNQKRKRPPPRIRIRRRAPFQLRQEHQERLVALLVQQLEIEQRQRS